MVISRRSSASIVLVLIFLSFIVIIASPTLTSLLSAQVPKCGDAKILRMMTEKLKGVIDQALQAELSDIKEAKKDIVLPSIDYNVEIDLPYENESASARRSCGATARLILKGAENLKGAEKLNAPAQYTVYRSEDGKIGYRWSNAGPTAESFMQAIELDVVARMIAPLSKGSFD